MSKRLGLVLVALLVLPLLITACDTDSRDAGEDYVKAVMTGDEARALELACDSYQDQTQQILEFYAPFELSSDDIDLKFDIGKGNDVNEIIVTGAFTYERDEEYELAGSVRLANLPAWITVETEDETNLVSMLDGDLNVDTRLVLDMQEQDGDWCVNSIDFGDVVVLEPMAPSVPADADAADADTGLDADSDADADMGVGTDDSADADTGADADSDAGADAASDADSSDGS